MNPLQRIRAAWATLTGGEIAASATSSDKASELAQWHRDLQARDEEIARLRAAAAQSLLGPTPASTVAPVVAATATAERDELAAKLGDCERDLARLRFDLQARDGEITKLRAEFGLKESQAAAATSAAAQEALAGLCRSLASPLSQLATLRQLAEIGREVRAMDALKLAARIEETLSERGLERIGEVGEESVFDPAIHQRMSGADVRDGDRVRVRFVGYRFAGRAPVKALVSRIATAPETPQEGD